MLSPTSDDTGNMRGQHIEVVESLVRLAGDIGVSNWDEVRAALDSVKVAAGTRRFEERARTVEIQLRDLAARGVAQDRGAENRNQTSSEKPSATSPVLESRPPLIARRSMSLSGLAHVSTGGSARPALPRIEIPVPGSQNTTQDRPELTTPTNAYPEPSALQLVTPVLQRIPDRTSLPPLPPRGRGPRSRELSPPRYLAEPGLQPLRATNLDLKVTLTWQIIHLSRFYPRYLSINQSYQGLSYNSKLMKPPTCSLAFRAGFASSVLALEPAGQQRLKRVPVRVSLGSFAVNFPSVWLAPDQGKVPWSRTFKHPKQCERVKSNCAANSRNPVN
ncbi:hypothetical protein HDU93_004874 [Gonapodya sp. JEL0774]|nr:hypothetical protein HDU93_004874 [Gonapodya sp. JEL0774]